MDILPLLEEVQTIARNGLTFSDNPYDTERYTRLLELATNYYCTVFDVPEKEIKNRLFREFGYITPKVGAEAAIFNENGHILLIKRSDDKKWCLPCGWVEPNETTVSAIIREVFEETGLKVEVQKLIDVFSRFPSYENGPHSQIAVLYLCKVVSGVLMKSPHEALDLRYWEIDKVTDWHKNHKKFAEISYKVWSESKSKL